MHESESEVSQSCLTLPDHGLQPTRLLCPWDFPGKSTGVGRHCLLLHIYIYLLFSHSDSLQPHGLQHTRLPCPSPSPRVCSNPLHLLYHLLMTPWAAVLATVNSAAVNFGVRVSSSYFFHFLQIHAQEWNFWVLMGAAFLVFLRNLHAVFHSGCTSLHSPCGKTTFCLSDGKYKTQEQGAMFHAQRSVWSRSP